jgi:hypothetical protein
MLQAIRNFSFLLLIAAACGTLGYRTAAAEPPAPANEADISAHQLNTVCDLRKLPVPKDALVHESTQAELVLTSALELKHFEDFYRRALAEHGYQPATEKDPEWNTDGDVTVPFAKDGNTVLLHLHAASDTETWIALHRCGKFDLRTLPQSSEAKVEYVTPTTLKYVCKNRVKDECVLLKRELAKAGWQQYYNSMGISVQWEDTYHTFTFRKRGYLLFVRVKEVFKTPQAMRADIFDQDEEEIEEVVEPEIDDEIAEETATTEPESSPTEPTATTIEDSTIGTEADNHDPQGTPFGRMEPGPTEVQYSIRTLPRELPAPTTAYDIQIDPDFGKLNCRVPGSMEVVAKYYFQAMPAVGHKPLVHDSPGSNFRQLRFEAEDRGVIVVELFERTDFKDLFLGVRYYSPQELDEVPPPMIQEADDPADDG